MACSLENTRKQMVSLKMIDSDGYIIRPEQSEQTRQKALNYARSYREQARQAQQQKDFERARQLERDAQEMVQVANKEFTTVPEELQKRLNSYAKFLLDNSPIAEVKAVPFNVKEGKVVFNQQFFNTVDKKNAESIKLSASSAIKPGVKELFDSNPELANQVYEALGLEKTFNGYNVNNLLNEVINKSKNKDLVYVAKLLNSKDFIGKLNILEKKLDRLGENQVSFIEKNIISNVYIDSNKIKDSSTSFEEVVLHELMHRYTSFIGISKQLQIPISEKENEFYKDMSAAYTIYTEKGFKDLGLDEFIAQSLTNKEVINNLKSIKIDNTNLFERIINFVKKLIYKQTNTLFDFTSASVTNYINNLEDKVIENYYSESELTPQQKQQALQLYSQYLDTIFTSGTIVYKGVTEKNKFNKWFALDKPYAAKWGIPTPYFINTAEVFNISTFEKYFDKPSYIRDRLVMGQLSIDSKFESELKLLELDNPKVAAEFLQSFEKSSVISGPEAGFENNISFYVKNIDDIHKLGDSKDIEAFKRFVQNRSASLKPGTQLSLLLQKQSKAPSITSDDLNTTIKNFLNKIGVSYQAVENLTDINGKPISGIALANLLDKVIQVVEGKAGLDTLPEEAAHFFVGMLPKDSHLYQTMFKSISDYQVYGDVLEEYGEDPLYKGNITKLKEEAIGKLISQHIIRGFQGIESEKNLQKANNWWNMVWEKIKKMLFVFDKKAFYDAANQANAFEISASMILKGDVTELRGEAGGEIFLQKSTDEALKVKDTIESVSDRMIYDKDKVDKENKKSGYGIKSTKESTEYKDIKNRTSNIVEELSKKRGWAERTEEQQKMDKISKEFGTNTHSALKNIIDRYAEKLQNNEVTAKDTFGLSDSKYSQLSSYVNKLLKSYDPGSIILSEVMVYNENRDLAGTIDLLIIKPDGTIDIYDWKTINMSGKKEIPFYKEEEWNVQLTSYKNTLKSYGLTKFGKLRIIPIATNWDKNMNIQSISIGGENLEQVPLTGLQGGDVELTGNEAIDKLIEVLVQSLKKVYELKIPFEDTKKRQLRTARIENLKASIKELQLKQTYEAFLEEAQFELDLMKESGLDTYDNEEIVDAKRVATFYSRILEKGFVSKSILKDNYKDFSKVQVKASEMLANINFEIEKRSKEIAESVDIDNLLEAQEEPHVLARWFRSISQVDHPVIKSFYRLVSKQKDKVYKESKKLYFEIDKAVKDLKEYSKGQGVSGNDIFKPFLKFKDGKWTGNLISKFKEEVYEKRDQALKNRDKESLEFLRENFNFDRDRFTKIRNENIKTWEKLFKKSKYKESIVKKKLADFDAKYNISSNPFTAYGKQNFFLSVKDKWYSEEYKKIQSTPELKKFYDLFTNTIASNKEYLDVNLMPSFVPNIRKDLIDGIAQNGWSAISGLKESFVDAITAKSDANYGVVDESTGQFKKTIPIYYTQAISPEMKSTDLGRSLYLFANMALNHKYMSEIEASSQILQDVLENKSKAIVTDALGKPIKGLSGKIKEKLNSSDTLSQFNAFMDYYLYGINSIEADKPIEIKGTNISTKKVFSQTLKWFSAKSLSLNVLSGFANFFGGNTNALMEGSKGRFYNKKQYYNGIILLTTKKDIAFQAIEFFDIGSNTTDFQRASKLSASSISKNLTFDKFYALQQGGEWTVENLTLLAMLQSHTINNGKIVKKKADEVSLIDQMKIVDDKLEVPGLTDEEYSKFRRKVKYLYTTMKGNMSSEDISMVRLTVLGQAMMQFKNWIARMADERIGNLRYTQDLEMWEQGKYKTWWNHTIQLIAGNFANLLTGVAGNGVLGIGSDMFNNSLNQAGQKHYDTLKPEQKSKITREEYAEMYAANVRAGAAEVQVIIVCAVILAALKGEDDDDKDPARKYIIKMANRNLQEITFFINPKSAATIIGSGAKTTVPVMGLFIDIFDFFSEFLGQGVGVVTLDEERMDKNKPIRKFLNLFPATNSLERLWEDLSEDEE